MRFDIIVAFALGTLVGWLIADTRSRRHGRDGRDARLPAPEFDDRLPLPVIAQVIVVVGLLGLSTFALLLMLPQAYDRGLMNLSPRTMQHMAAACRVLAIVAGCAVAVICLWCAGAKRSASSD